jgi:2-succinyl-6-hydroxy-2,4-cyclohexadiene-1-carboxylate synthase
VEDIKIYFLHGFLGLPKDWEPIAKQLENQFKCQTVLVDYLNQAHLGPKHSFEDWAQHFNREVETSSASVSKNILVGYSLGGRLALHALESHPRLWNQVFCLSTNPGFDDDKTTYDALSEERRQRWLSDSLWAEEFQSLSWNKVLSKWNAQAVFAKSSKEPLRNEADYSKESLSLALIRWSLSKQRNLRPIIRKHVDRLQWMVGERDQKFISITDNIYKKIPELRWNKVPEASHRLIFDNSKFVADRLADYIRKS